MVYTPVKNTKKVSAVCLALVLSALVCLAFRGYGYPVVLQTAAIGFFGAFVLLFYRWIFSSYVYEIRDGELIVTLLQGKRRTDVCRLPLSQMKGIRQGRERIRGKMYTYTVSLGAKNVSTLLFDDGGDTIALYLEAGEDFLSALRQNRL